MASAPPISQLLNDPRVNRELALLNRAQELARTFTGRVPGGRLATNSATLLKDIAPRPSGNIADILNKDADLPQDSIADVLFDAIESGKVDVLTQLRALTAQREALQKKEAQAKAEREQLLTLGRSNDPPPDFKQRVDKFLAANQENDGKPPAKSRADITTIPATVSVGATEVLAFDRNNDKTSDFAQLTVEASLQPELAQLLTVQRGNSVNLANALGEDAANPFTHVAVRLSGAKHKVIDQRYPKLPPHIEALQAPTSKLELAGNTLTNDDYTVLTLAEWKSLILTAPTSDRYQEFADFLSIIPFRDSNNDQQLDGNDQRGEYRQVAIRAATDIVIDPSQDFQRPGGIDDSQSIALPNALLAKKFDLHLYGNSIGANFLEDIANGHLHLFVYEQGRTGRHRVSATLDQANSNGNRLRFNFDDLVTDGLEIEIVRSQPGVLVRQLTAAIL